MMTFSNGIRNGIRVPGWAIAGILAAAVVLSLGFKLGAQVSASNDRVMRLETQLGGLDFRLCRIERALQIAVYQTCAP